MQKKPTKNKMQKPVKTKTKPKVKPKEKPKPRKPVENPEAEGTNEAEMPEEQENPEQQQPTIEGVEINTGGGEGVVDGDGE